MNTTEQIAPDLHSEGAEALHPWWQSQPNLGSAARDHLANERTFLAWVRTSIATTALGVALEHIKADGQPNTPILGMAFIVGGIITLVYGTARYFQVRRQIATGYFGSARLGPVAIAMLGLVLAIFALSALP